MKKRNVFFKKTLILLGGLILVLLFINSTMQNFEEEKADLRDKLGEEVTGGQLSISEYILLCEKTIGIYISAARSGDFRTTYSLLTPEYRDVIDYDKYVESIKNIEFNTAYIEKITPVTTNLYQANVIFSGDVIQEYLILLAENNFSIIPDKFLMMEELNKKINKKKVEYQFDSYEIYTDFCVFNVTITNNGKENVIISGANMRNDKGLKIETDINYTIAPDETKKISVSIETKLSIPTAFELIRETDKKYMYYHFEI